MVMGSLLFVLKTSRKLLVHIRVDRRYIWTDRLDGGTEMDLLALTDFNLVARHGGFGRAARAAGRPKATLSRRVAELEASLDLRLFERGARNIKLTEEG